MNYSFRIVKNDKATVDSTVENVVHYVRQFMDVVEDHDSDSRLAKTYAKLSTDNKSIVDMLADTIRLSGTNLITADEYLEYRLYNKPKKEQKEYISNIAIHSVWKKFNKRHYPIFDNKEIANSIIRNTMGEDAATKDLGVFDATNLTKSWLKRHTPLFMKPTNGICGLDTIRINGYSRLRDSFKTPIGPFTYEEIIDRMGNRNYLVSKIVKSNFNPKFAAKSKGLNTIRFITLKGNIIGAAYKISMYGNFVDNFSKFGNYAIGIDLAYGKTFDTAYCGKDYLAEHDMKVTPEHVPDWNNVLVFVEKAAKVFNHTKLLGFDIATTDNGPVIVDVNCNPGIRLLQIPYQKGFKSLLK